MPGEARTYMVAGREIDVTEDEGGWRVCAGHREASHRYLDRALARALGISSLSATELAAAILQRPEGGEIS